MGTRSSTDTATTGQHELLLASATAGEWREQIRQAVDTADFGTASARKTGRNPKWPHVPVLNFDERGAIREHQVLGLAYKTRTEAIEAAEKSIGASRARLVKDLAKRGHRPLREKYGLPREIPAGVASELHETA